MANKQQNSIAIVAEKLVKKYGEGVLAVEGIEHFGDSNNMVIFLPTEIHSTI